MDHDCSDPSLPGSLSASHPQLLPAFSVLAALFFLLLPYSLSAPLPARRRSKCCTLSVYAIVSFAGHFVLENLVNLIC
ncbi:hypothetical protein P152DRAFT_169542 [Eremomyces bilateralis CBS 781.70]|uniref:Uncharacterized protein n=1 Tax=Eremomyces bilateralis CBS 781.70 TaxID=1392243 RepID=A0A6G1FTN0_9PEZI|nr:uncharacterized protein P152DRAFT_169542 [Eremomyces bilateralis CBS 781.70]KAF1809113.1 hypothetical protein P152DRAFT_169542 [Eremomyces bilateralis CBS 781.70]